MRKKIPNFGKILDYGANDGHVTFRLFKKHPPSDVYVADVQNKLSIENKKHGWHYLEVNPQTSSINVDDCFFDTVTCMHVLEHVPKPENPLREFFRVMKKKGKLYLETPNQRSLYTPSLTNDRTWNFYDDATHIRPFTEGALRSMCQNSGFKILKSGIYREWKYALALPVAPLISLFLKDWRPVHYALIHAIGWSSYCWCEKP